MSAEPLAEKYIGAMEKTLLNLQLTQRTISVTEDCALEILGYVKAYLEDSKYFREQKQYETSLTSIAYSEGLLDALKLIGAVKIETTF